MAQTNVAEISTQTDRNSNLLHSLLSPLIEKYGENRVLYCIRRSLNFLKSSLEDDDTDSETSPPELETTPVSPPPESSTQPRLPPARDMTPTLHPTDSSTQDSTLSSYHTPTPTRCSEIEEVQELSPSTITPSSGQQTNSTTTPQSISPQLVGHVNIYDNPTFHPNPLDPNPYQVHRYRLYRIHIAPRLSSLSNFIANWILN